MKRASTVNDKEARIKTILKAALSVFIKKGYKNASLREIARAAKLESAGTIYLYFKGKGDLYGAVYESVFQRSWEMEKKAAMVDGTPLQKLIAVSKEYVNFQSHPDSAIFEINLKELNLSNDLNQKFNTLYRNWFNTLSAIIEEGKRTGFFKPDLDIKMLTTSIYTSLEGIAYYSAYGNLDDIGVDTDELIIQQLNYLVKGIGTEKATTDFSQI